MTGSSHLSAGTSPLGRTAFCVLPASRQNRGQFLSGFAESLAPVLSCLRTEIGDIEFGHRAQAFFAHVLQHIGARVLEIRHQGHPDIVASLGGRFARFEVEVASGRDRDHTIKSDDLMSIRPVHSADAGFLAILDATHPVRWAVIEHSRIRKRLGRWPLATLHAIADADLSRRCTAAFREILCENRQHLQALTFHLLCDRVLRDSDA